MKFPVVAFAVAFASSEDINEANEHDASMMLQVQRDQERRRSVDDDSAKHLDISVTELVLGDTSGSKHSLLETAVSFELVGDGYARKNENGDWHCWWSTKSAIDREGCESLCAGMSDVDCLGYTSSTDGSDKCFLYTSSCWVPDTEPCCEASNPNSQELGPWAWTAPSSMVVSEGTDVQTYWRREKCTCRNGDAAFDDECTQDGAEICTSCKVGYTLGRNKVCHQVSFDLLGSGQGYPRTDDDEYRCWINAASDHEDCEALCSRQTGDVNCYGYTVNSRDCKDYEVDCTHTACSLYLSQCVTPNREFSKPIHKELGSWSWSATTQSGGLIEGQPTLTYWRQENTCTCEHGDAAQSIAAESSECTENGAEICTHCDDGYTLNSNKVCVEKKCGCRHGTAAQLSECTEDGAEICISCNDGFTLNSNQICHCL